MMDYGLAILLNAATKSLTEVFPFWSCPALENEFDSTGARSDARETAVLSSRNNSHNNTRGPTGWRSSII